MKLKEDEVVVVDFRPPHVASRKEKKKKRKSLEGEK